MCQFCTLYKVYYILKYIFIYHKVKVITKYKINITYKHIFVKNNGLFSTGEVAVIHFLAASGSKVTRCPSLSWRQGMRVRF